MTNTTTSLAARELACNIIKINVDCALGRVSAYVADPNDRRQRSEAELDARNYIMSHEFQEFCDDLLLPDNFVERTRRLVLEQNKVWQPRLKVDMVEA